MRIKSAKHVKGFTIQFHFSNGEDKIVDFAPILKQEKKLLIPLRDLTYFKKFSVDESTICWPNQLDFCPDVLYELGQPLVQKPNELLQRKSRRKVVKSTATVALSKKNPKRS